MTIEDLKTRRASAFAAQQQMIANVNALAGQVALLDEMIASAEAEEAKKAEGSENADS